MNQADPKEQPSLQTQQQFVAIPPDAFYPQQQKGEIDLAELWRGVWHGKFIIVIVTALFALMSVVYALSIPSVYRASTTLVPAHQNAGSAGLSSIAGQFSGLASFAGINIGRAQTNKTDLALQVLRSRAFIEQFIEKNQIQYDLLAVKKWEKRENKLVYDEALFDLESGEWKRDSLGGYIYKPTAWELYERFVNLLYVSTDKESGMITVEIEYYEPSKAQLWLGMLIAEINEFMRLKDQNEAQQSIDYLTSKLDDTNVANMESVFYHLIEEQTKNMMLTMVKKEYVLETIDPPNVPDHRAKPKRSLIVIIGVLIGLLSSIIVALIKYFLFPSSQKQSAT